MKQISCETCGSSNLIKNDNVFICQQCGARYSLDAIKKMASNDNMASDFSGSGDSTSGNVTKKSITYKQISYPTDIPQQNNVQPNPHQSYNQQNTYQNPQQGYNQQNSYQNPQQGYNQPAYPQNNIQNNNNNGAYNNMQAVPAKKKPGAGAVVGIVIGSVVFLSILAAIIIPIIIGITSSSPKQQIVGSWSCYDTSVSGGEIIYTFNKDGSGTISASGNTGSFTYSVNSNDNLIFTYETNTSTYTYGKEAKSTTTNTNSGYWYIGRLLCKLSIFHTVRLLPVVLRPLQQFRKDITSELEKSIKNREAVFPITRMVSAQ